MSDLTTAAADLEATEGARDQAKQNLDDAKLASADALAALVAAAANANDQEIKGAAEAVDYASGEIDRLTFDEKDGLKVRQGAVKTAARAMREAARAGNAQAEESNLAAAEAELADIKGNIRDLKKARKNAEISLRRLVAGIV